MARRAHWRAPALLAAIAAACLVFGATPAALAQNSESSAQPTDPTNLDSILAQLDANLREYETGVPSFFCKEHALSELQLGSDTSTYRRTVADSTFRVHRASDPGQPVQLEESRIVNTIDGKPQAGDAAQGDTIKIDSPLAVFGVFSGALKLVTTSSRACFQYRLHPPHKNSNTPLVIDFSSLPAKERGADCQYLEKTSGKALIDPASMRVVHMDTRTSDHEILPGIRGDWDWSIDYSRVTLNGKTFWLPSSIRSTAIPESTNVTPDNAPTIPARGAVPYSNKPPSTTMASKAAPTYHLLETFTAYHLLTVESRILPATTDPVSVPATLPQP
jgi:hypothetical protein